MKKKVLWMTRTAVVLALLVSVQALTKPFGQLVTGSCVNLVLALSVMLSGLLSGVIIALFSPVMAFILGIASQVLTLPAIMAGNCVYVLLLYLLTDKKEGKIWRQGIALLSAAAAKFAVLYGAVAGLVCGILADRLMAAVLLKAPMLRVLPATFGWPQLVTALLGGALAFGMLPVLKKALC